MSADERTTDQNTDRKILYTIHYDATKSSLPKIYKTLRLGGTELSIKALHRDLHVKLFVGGVSKTCDSRGKKPTDFIVGRGSEVRIELYAEHTLRQPVCIASKTRRLASLIDPGHPVPLDIVDPCLTTPPILSLRAQVTGFNPGIGENVDGMARSLALAEKWLALGDYARRVVDIGSIVAEVHPVAKAIFSVLELGVEELEKRKEYHDNILSLVADMTKSCEVVLESDTQQCAERREHQVNACNALVPEIFRVLSFIRALVSKSTVSRLRSKINEEAENLRKGLNEIADAVKGARHIDTQNAVFRVEDIVTRIDIDNTLSHLQIAKGVEAASIKACLPDTRVMLLETIMDWVFDPDGSRCFCLYGTAGQGKTAVAHSVARRLADMGVAAPFFAFDRNNRERVASQLLPTIARSLAYVIQHQLEQLRKLRADQLETTDIPKQCERLFLSCLRDYLVLTPIIIVIDALDECPNDSVDDQKDREAVLKALKTCIATSTNGLHHNIRFFVTARLDPDIQAILSGDATLTRLYSIDAAAETRADIRRFVALELSDAKTVGYVDIVTDAAQTHFECAAVLCRELKNGGKPMSSDARNKLIERIKSQPGRSLYETYQLILETHLDKTDAGCLSVYRQLLSWILTVRQPQPRSVFAEIAKLVLRNEDTMGVLEGLGSLLTGTVANAQDPIRPLHTSFRDYVLDAEASGVFCITSEFDAANSQLALACFGIMSRPTSGLRYNICDLRTPFVYKEDVENLDGRLTEHVSPALHYACREISVHLSRCESRNVALALVSALKGFLQDRFLFWLEACGWLGYEPCDVLQEMLEWAKKHDSDNSAPLVSDFILFAKRYREAISRSPPQVYITGLLFAPVNSHVSRLYRHCIAGPIEISGYDQEREWPPGETLVIQARSIVFSVAYSPDGARIVAGLRDSTLRIWDARTGGQVGGAMQGHTDWVLSVAFSPDGSRIASGSQDHTVRLWDAKTSQQQGEALRGHTGWVRSAAFSPDGVTVVSGSYDRTLRSWNAQTGRQMGDALEGWVHTAVFSHDGTCIISGAEDKTVRIWDTATHRQLGDPIQHEGMVMSVAISRDDKYIASGSSDGNIRVWDIEGRQQVWALQAHKGWVFAVAFSPDSSRIVSGGDDNTVRIWEAASGKQVGDDLHGHTGDVNSVAFSPDGRHVASGSYDMTIRVWDVREVKKEGGRPVGHTGAVLSVACSSDGKYIASGSHDKTVRLWDAQTGQPVGEPMTGHDGDVNCVTFSPDSTRVASASYDRTVRVWDVTTRLLMGDALEGHDSHVLCVAFSPDGNRLVSGSADKTLRLWDLATGRQIGEPLCSLEDWVRSVSFSSDGLCVASCSDDGSIRLWDAQLQLQTGKVLKGHEDWVRSVAFSPDDAFLASGSDDGTIRLWDTHTGEQMCESLTGHSGYILSVFFSHDGKYVVSGSDDQTVRVWDVQTRQQVGVALRGNENWVTSVAFSSDGSRIVSGSEDGTIRLWDFGSLQSLEDLINDASASMTRSRAQAALWKSSADLWDGWMVYRGDDNDDDTNGSDDNSMQPLLWIPHYLRHCLPIVSPYQIQFIPPAPQVRITLNNSFRLDQWPTFTPAPAAEESLAALGREE